MFYYTTAILGAVLCSALLQAAAFDVTEKRVEHVDLTEKDIVAKEDLVWRFLFCN